MPPDKDLETIADLDFGSNLYLTPFGAEQTQIGNQAAVKVNVNTASPEVLKALIEGVLDLLMQRRRPPPSSAESVVEAIRYYGEKNGAFASAGM